MSLWIAFRSYRIAQEASEEQRAVVLDVRPSISIGDLTDELASVRVTIVNESLRNLVIPTASLWIEDCKIGNVEQWLPNAAIFDQRFLDLNWAEHALELPITVEARQGSAIALLVPYNEPCLPSTGPISEADWERSREIRRRFLDTLNEGWLNPMLRNERDLRLIIDVAPGGRMVRRLRIEAGMTPGESWQIGAILRKRNTRFVGIDVRRKLGEPGQATLVTVEIWEVKTSFHRRLRRPVVGDRSTLFTFGTLAAGKYMYVVGTGDRTITGGRFRIRE